MKYNQKLKLRPTTHKGQDRKPLVTLAGKNLKGFKSLTSALVVLGPYGPMHINSTVLPGHIKLSISATCIKIVISKISEDRAFHRYLI